MFQGLRSLLRQGSSTHEKMKLIAGLGNPGSKYVGTRHNVGFEVLAELAGRFDAGRPKAKFNAELAEIRIGSEKVVLLSPLTYMNRSGQSIGAAMDFYRCKLADLLVICDDLNLDLARLRFRPGGSAGGQNGLKDIIQRLGTQDFNRLRIGVGRPPAGRDAADFVLGKFTTDEQPTIQAGCHRAAVAVETWVCEGLSAAMNVFNAAVPSDPTDGS